MGRCGNYWSACRGRSTAEFIAKLGIATDEADESVLWLTSIIQSGIKQDLAHEGTCSAKERNCGRSSRSLTRRLERIAAGRRAKKREKRGKESTHQFTDSPIHQNLSEAFHNLFPAPLGPAARVPGEGVASGSSTRSSCVRKSSRSGSM